MSDKKKFSQLEQETGMFAIDEKKYDLSRLLTKDEFLEIVHGTNTDFAAVVYEPRVKFLQDNGYKVTRANLIDPNLSAKPKD